MPQPRSGDWGDEEILTALHMRDHDRKSATVIARELGRSRGSVCGQLHRVDRLIEEHDQEAIQNGTLGPMWWKR